MVNHRRACTAPVDVTFADYQHQHWENNHSHRHEQAKRRLNRKGR